MSAAYGGARMVVKPVAVAAYRNQQRKPLIPVMTTPGHRVGGFFIYKNSPCLFCQKFRF
jgi:hypothetical protein